MYFKGYILANRYWVGGNAIWNSTAGTKWSATSGGAGGASIPTSADDVFFNAASGSNTITLGTGYAATAKSLNCTGFVGTLASTDTTGTITVSGAVTFVTGMTITATNTLVFNATATQTSGGKTWTGNITFNQFTHTLADTWNIGGIMKTVVSNGPTTINGNSINCNGLNITGATHIVLGTTTINITGGTWSHSSTGVLRNNLNFNSSSTFTISGNVYYNTGTITYIAGTGITTGSTINVNASVTINTGLLNLGSITIINNPTITLLSTTNLNGSLSVTNNNGNTTINGSTFSINVGGSLTFGGAFNVIGTISNITMNGTGTWSNSSICALRIPLVFNTTGVITISGIVYIQNGCSITYTAGTLVTTGSTINASIPNPGDNVTFNINRTSAIINNLTISGLGTVTLGANLKGTGTISITPTTTASITFLGLFGWDFVNLFVKSSYCNIVLVQSQTYTINGGTMTCTGTEVGPLTIKSSTSTKAILTLTGSVTQVNTYLNGTDIDSSLGNTVYTWLGVLSNTINWNIGAQPRVISIPFIS